MNRTDLLAEFRAKRSEAAFGELVRHQTNFVYSVAMRRLCNVSLAQEVTQLVFIKLAKAVPQISSDAHLVAWLHRTTVHVSIDLWRAETRRRAREEHAVAMQFNATEDIVWKEMAPVLDEALNELSDADRQAILLRYFNEKSMREVGESLGISEDAAKMRVNRALEKLRTQLSARGVTCSALVLASLIAGRAVEAAPAAFAANLASFSFPIAAGVGASGWFASLLQVTRIKMIGGIATVIVVGVATFLGVRSRTFSPLAPALSPQTGEGDQRANSQPQAAGQGVDGDAAAAEREPDPVKLLQRIVRVRQRFASGSIDFHVTIDHFESRRKETDHFRLNATFDGIKHRVESFTREYAYTPIGPESSEANEAKIRAQGLDRDAAVRAGLLERFEAHYVTTYDGANLLRYRETTYGEANRRSTAAEISDPNKGSASFIFDPRCLGLRTSVSAGDTMELCLRYTDAKSIRLVGKEFVEGDAAWHVEVKRKIGDTLDFWIDVAHPDHLLKHAYGHDVVLSKYHGADAIPTEVKAMHYRNGAPLFFTEFVRSNTTFNIRIDPSSWTLAGLGMKVGTDVSDDRISRRIGYWTGAGLSENLPEKGSKPQPAPNLDELMIILDTEPASELGLQTAAWILLNTPDGPEVERSGEIVIREHIQNPNLTYLCKEMERVRHRCAKKLLQAALDKNPNAEVQATACFILATLWKDEADHGKNKKATAEAEKLFQRSVNGFSGSGKVGADYARRAKGDLSELRRLIIGKTAPDFEGETFDGQIVKLSDYRGKVLVLIFWTASVAEVGDENRKLIERMADKPVAFLGVNCDKDLERAKSTAEKRHITWPTIWDGRSGPIRTDWNVDYWPNMFVLDRKGVIRYRDVRDGLEKAIEALLREHP